MISVSWYKRQNKLIGLVSTSAQLTCNFITIYYLYKLKQQKDNYQITNEKKKICQTKLMKNYEEKKQNISQIIYFLYSGL